MPIVAIIMAAIIVLIFTKSYPKCASTVDGESTITVAWVEVPVAVPLQESSLYRNDDGLPLKATAVPGGTYVTACVDNFSVPEFPYE